MLSFRTVNVILIILGVALGVWAQTYEPRNQYLLIGGIMLIMFAIYRVSRNLNSRSKGEEEETKDFVIDEKFDESEFKDSAEDFRNHNKS